MVFSGRKNRRRHKRRDVQWEAELYAKIAGVEETFTVQVANFSAGGALLHSEQMYAGPYHIALGDVEPVLRLKIFTPEGTLESKFNIRWYDRSQEQDTFLIGIEFVDMLEKNRETLDRVVDSF
jgi:c-di-GMP-binding flagellar brake protein YcgR